MIRFKRGVTLKTYSPAIHHMLSTLHAWLYEFAFPYDGETPEDMVVTSVNDGRHRRDSRHYTDEAIDLRSWSFPSKASKLAFREAYEEALNWRGPAYCHGKFSVLFEPTVRKAGKVVRTEHFHVQVKKGETLR